jgi:Ca-activated chloride channel homolog
MSFENPWLLWIGAVVVAGLGLGYRALYRRRARNLAAAGLRTPSRLRTHLPPLLFLVAIALLLVGVARPEATVRVPRVAGTVILAFDVSNSMTAKDATPTRLAAAQSAATGFVKAQPDSVDIGVVAFDQGALTTRAPTRNHDEAVAAINRLHAAGGTSLGQAILASLTAIVGHTVSLPDPNATDPNATDPNGTEPNAPAPQPSLGYWGSATIVLLSDGEDTGGPDALAAAALAAGAGVHVETIGFGTIDGTTITVDGYQVATALDEDLLTRIAQAPAGSYHRAGDAGALNRIYRTLDLRITAKPELLELTGVAVAVGVLLLTLGGILMVRWYGRIL